MKKTRLLLFTAILVVLLSLTTILAVGANDVTEPVEPTLDEIKIGQGYVARIGEGDGATYYETLAEAVSAITVDGTEVVLITDYTQAGASLPKNNSIAAYTLTSANGAVLTVDYSWLFDLGNNATVTPTVKNIEIDLGSNNLGYFNGTDVIIEDGAYIHGTGKSESEGLIYAHDEAEIIVRGGIIEVTSGKNPAIVLAKEVGPSKATITGGLFRHYGTGAILYAKSEATSTISGGRFEHYGNGFITRTDGYAVLYLTGGVNMIHYGKGESFIYYRDNGAFVANGTGVKLIATGNNYIFEQGYCDAAAGLTEGEKVTLRGAYLSTERADKSICYDEFSYIYLDGVQLDADVAYELVGYEDEGKAPTYVTAGEKNGLYYHVTALLATLADGDTWTVKNDQSLGGIVLDGKELTIVGEKKADGTYPTITRKSGWMFTLQNGAKLTLDKLNIVTGDGAILRMYGTESISAPYVAEGYSPDSTVVIVGADAKIVSTDSVTNAMMVRMEAGYSDIVVKGEMIYEGNESGKNMYMFRADDRAWSGKLTIFGKLELNASKAKDWFSLVRAFCSGATVDVRDGAVLTMNLTGDAASAYTGVNSLIWNHGTTIIGSATFNGTVHGMHTADQGSAATSAENATLRIVGRPVVNLARTFFSADHQRFNITRTEAVAFGYTARIDQKYFVDLAAAISACPNGGTITIFDDSVIVKQTLITKDVKITSEARADGSFYTLADTTTGQDSTAFKITFGELSFENINIKGNGLFIQMYAQATFGAGVTVTVNTTNRFIYCLVGSTITFNEGAKFIIENASSNFLRCDSGTVIINGGSFEVFSAGNDVFRNTGTLVMNGGEILNHTTSNAFYTTGDANSFMQFNGGTVISENAHTVYADAGRGEINGGTFEQHAAYVVNALGTSSWSVTGGLFVGDTESSAATATNSLALLVRNAAGASLSVSGGMYLMYNRDAIMLDYTERSNSVWFLKNENSVISYKGNDYYFMAYTEAENEAPELKQNVTLDVERSALVFGATLSAADRDAVLLLANTLAGEGVYTLTYGVLVAKVDDIYAAGAFTKEALKAAGLRSSSREFVVTNAEGDQALTVSVPIGAANYGVFYAAVPYVVITVGEETTVIYGSYQTGDAVSVSTIAHQMLHDVTDRVVGEYQHESIAYANAYSRYAAATQRTLRTMIAHAHTYNYKGVCTACGVNGAVVFDVDNTTKIYIKYENEYNYVLSLEAGVSYQFTLSKNIAKLALFAADGTTCNLVDGVYACTESGTYYLKASADLVGDAILSFNHVHQANYKGECSVSFCEEDLCEEIATEQQFLKMFKRGNVYYYAVDLLGGVKYQVLAINGIYAVYNVEGDEMTLVNSTMTAPEDGVYYVAVTATVNAKGGVNVKHIHTYGTDGTCVLEECDHSVNVKLEVYKEHKTTYGEGFYYYSVELEAGKTYYFTFSDRVGALTLYNENLVEVEIPSSGALVAPETGLYYAVLESDYTGNASVVVEVNHTCEYTYAGICNTCYKNRSVKLTQGANGKLTAMLAGYLAYFYTENMQSATYALTLPENVEIAVYGMADGEFVEVEVSGDSFVWDSEACGNVAYIVVTATTDISGGTIKISHVHDYNYKGDCTVSGCNMSVRNIVSVGAPAIAKFTAGGTYYYSVAGLTVGAEYEVTFTGAEGNIKVYLGDGTPVAVTGGTFKCEAQSTYYIVVEATADSQPNAKILLSQK